MSLVAPGLGAQQGPSAAIPDALRSLTAGFGGCSEAPLMRDTTIDYFPNVRFIRGYCTLEHGDPTTAIVGIDADSVLYLLGSLEAFRFLTRRHPPPPVDSAGVLAYLTVALELSGQVTAHTVFIQDFDQLPDSVGASLSRSDQRPISIFRQAGGRYMNVWLYTLDPGFYGPYVHRRNIAVLSNGYLVLAQDSLIYRPPGAR